MVRDTPSTLLNGGLAGSDVRILSRSSRKCTVTGIDSHEIQGHDVVQCAALVETNHGIVNLIMNEYACYGKGYTIHSSEWWPCWIRCEESFQIL